MLPLGNRVAVRRTSHEESASASGIILPPPDLGFAHIGRVTAVGRPVRDIEEGDELIYSSRVDTFILDDNSTVDIVEENSVIGKMK